MMQGSQTGTYIAGQASARGGGSADQVEPAPREAIFMSSGGDGVQGVFSTHALEDVGVCDESGCSKIWRYSWISSMGVSLRRVFQSTSGYLAS